jgi:hypothetical protein
MIAAAFRASLWGVMTFAAFALGVDAILLGRDEFLPESLCSAPRARLQTTGSAI